MSTMVEQFRKIGIIPVVVLEDAADAEPLARALCEGGLPCAEVTFRTAAAEESIRIMTEKFPEMLVGAGTVLTKDQVDRAVAAGAKFMVSPGIDPELVRYCQEKNVPITTGVQTPTEITMALNHGITTVKFFPAEPSGGLSMIKALAAAFVDVTFMPTGGINATNVQEYLKYDKIVACGGSWMVKKDLIKAGEFDKIKEMVAEASAIVRSIRG